VQKIIDFNPVITLEEIIAEFARNPEEMRV
jgi:hypothetical protein